MGFYNDWDLQSQKPFTTRGSMVLGLYNDKANGEVVNG